MSISIPGVVKNGSPWDQLNSDLYGARASLMNWLIHYSFPAGDRNRLRMLKDEEMAQLLAQAEAAEAVPTRVAAAYRSLFEMKGLADGPPDGVSAADEARGRELFEVVRAWLETQG